MHAMRQAYEAKLSALQAAMREAASQHRSDFNPSNTLLPSAFPPPSLLSFAPPFQARASQAACGARPGETCGGCTPHERSEAFDCEPTNYCKSEGVSLQAILRSPGSTIKPLQAQGYQHKTPSRC